jgi:hypothetical protein
MKLVHTSRTCEQTKTAGGTKLEGAGQLRGRLSPSEFGYRHEIPRGCCYSSKPPRSLIKLVQTLFTLKSNSTLKYDVVFLFF